MQEWLLRGNSSGAHERLSPPCDSPRSPLAGAGLASSCVVTPGGDVTFEWTFSGANCASTGGLASVQVAIPGQTLANAGLYPCDSAGTDGIQLLDIAAGTYSFRSRCRASICKATVLYSTSGTRSS